MRSRPDLRIGSADHESGPLQPLGVFLWQHAFRLSVKITAAEEPPTVGFFFTVSLLAWVAYILSVPPSVSSCLAEFPASD
jgi:hypothetical protein